MFQRSQRPSSILGYTILPSNHHDFEHEPLNESTQSLTIRTFAYSGNCQTFKPYRTKQPIVVYEYTHSLRLENKQNLFIFQTCLIPSSLSTHASLAGSTVPQLSGNSILGLSPLDISLLTDFLGLVSVSCLSLSNPITCDADHPFHS